MNNTDDEIIDEKTFGLRLARLRQSLNVSAREMSLALGQNKNYINTIETGKTFPSMSSFLYICRYLKIRPKDFFDLDFNNPTPYDEFSETYRKLTPAQSYHLQLIAEDLVHNDI